MKVYLILILFLQLSSSHENSCSINPTFTCSSPDDCALFPANLTRLAFLLRLSEEDLRGALDIYHDCQPSVIHFLKQYVMPQVINHYLIFTFDDEEMYIPIRNEKELEFSKNLRSSFRDVELEGVKIRRHTIKH